MRPTVFVNKFFFAQDAIQQLPQLLKPLQNPVILIDVNLKNQIPHIVHDSFKNDSIIYIDTSYEPTVEYVDKIVADLRTKNSVDGVFGMGGGSTLDFAKAVSNLLTNPGSAADYQGWDLVKQKGIFKVGIPTLSGTGAETSRTCVLMNKAKNLKLGMNSEFSVFDCLILDSKLSKSVPKDQFFYTAMDTYIHCVESLRGSFRHAIADALSIQALDLCREVFESDNLMSEENREKIMTASFFGGCAIANSYVGVVHPFSAGLSMVFGTRHCVGNCIVMNVMDDFYPEESKKFREYVKKHNITLPTGMAKSLSPEQKEKIYAATVCHEKPLVNALGNNYKDTLTPSRVVEIFERM